MFSSFLTGIKYSFFLCFNLSLLLICQHSALPPLFRVLLKTFWPEKQTILQSCFFLTQYTSSDCNDHFWQNIIISDSYLSRIISKSFSRWHVRQILREKQYWAFFDLPKCWGLEGKESIRESPPPWVLGKYHSWWFLVCYTFTPL